MGYAFISYSTKDQAPADEMKRLLEAHGIRTWMAPGDIPPGSKYAQAINVAIKECACVVLMLSEAAQESMWVSKEIERAINYRKQVFPVQLDDVVLNDEFELYISSNQLIRMSVIDGDSPLFRRLLASLTPYTGTQEAPTPVAPPRATSIPVAEEEDEDEDDEEEEEELHELQDISFPLYDKNGLYVEFCNFAYGDDKVFVSFWAKNSTEQAITLFAKGIQVNDTANSGSEFEYIGRISANDNDFCTLTLHGATPAGEIQVEGAIEIDNTDNRAIVCTPSFYLAANFDDESQRAMLHGEDISFALYDQDNLHIEFCNFLKAYEGDQHFTGINFWIKNKTPRDVKLWAMDIHVDGEYSTSFESLDVIKSGSSDFGILMLDKLESTGQHTIEGHIEIDDTNNRELARTPRFSIKIDFDDCAQSATLIPTEVAPFEDIAFEAYDTSHAQVQFCNFEVEDGVAYFNFWVDNRSNQTITVYAQDIYVDDALVSAYEQIGTFEAGAHGFGRFCLDGVTPDTCYTIECFVEIDNEYATKCIDTGRPFRIDVDFETSSLAADFK